MAASPLPGMRLCGRAPLGYGPAAAGIALAGPFLSISVIGPMRHPVLISLVCLALSLSGGMASGQTPAPAKDAQPKACSFLDLKLGPVVEVSADDEVNIDRQQERMRIVSGASVSLYDLTRGGSAELKELNRFAGQPSGRKLLTATTEATTKANPEAFAERLASQPEIILPNGRPVSVSRLYVNNYIVKVGSRDREAYQRFADEMREGRYCGTPVEKLGATLRKGLHSQVVYFLFDEISSGRIADYAAWLKYKPIFDTFLKAKEIEEYLEVYGYRSAEFGVSEPDLALMDPDKLWAFAWNQAAKLFHNKDSTEFTDLSIFQRDGVVTNILMGSQPIPDGITNKYGFYTRLEASLPVASLTGERSLSSKWMQGDREFTADVKISEPLVAPRPTITRFPGKARRGLIFLDATMIKADVDDLLKSYGGYYRDLGFKFGPQVPVSDVPAFFEREVGTGNLDYLVRDGHSDGDDENVIVLYPDGFVIEGKRQGPDGEESIKLVYNLKKEPKTERVRYDRFNELLRKRATTMPQPLVFVDGSCWGIEKAWFGLSQSPSSLMIEISSNAPVNFFENVRRNSMRRLFDGILLGHSFDEARKALAELPGYASKREDWFIFPDDALYPQQGRILAIDKRITVKEPGKPARQYIPDGYF